MPNTETLDRLYLEWSQFTRARTAREVELGQFVFGLRTYFTQLPDNVITAGHRELMERAAKLAEDTIPPLSR